MDPILSWSIAIFLSGLLIVSGCHKLSSPLYYRELIKKYIPVGDNPSIFLQYALGISEIGAGFLLLTPGVRGVAAMAVSGLLGIYLLLIASSLLRGIDMDCGCSGPLAGQKVSPWLLLRNGLLVMLSALLIWPPGSRQLGVLDLMLIIFSSIVIILLYLSFEHLLSNQQKLNRLRGI